MAELTVPQERGAAVYPEADPQYWHTLVDERVIAEFLDVTPRTVQAMRQKGSGPPFVRISARCVRYTRAMAKRWADARVRRSTSDPGVEAVAAR